MYDNWLGYAENWRKESLASNQVIGSSSLSGRAIFFRDLTHLRKFENSHRSPTLPQNS